MTEKKQGAAEWLRGITDQYETKVGPLCGDMAELFGLCCDEFETCPECRGKMMRVIADRIDAERALPEGIEWPRFEDGELVKIGDEVEFEGEVGIAACIRFELLGWSITLNRNLDLSYLSGAFGERVKRPTPKVLDADGAPIEVGDTVYCDDDPEPLVVDSFDDPGCVYLTSVKGSDRTLYTIEPSLLTHERPDSWEQLEKDAYHLVMSEYLETPEKDVSDLVRRAKALAKAGEEA